MQSVSQEEIVSRPAQTWEHTDTAGSEMAAVSASTSVAMTTGNSNHSARSVWQIRTESVMSQKIRRTNEKSIVVEMFLKTFVQTKAQAVIVVIQNLVTQLTNQISKQSTAVGSKR